MPTMIYDLTPPITPRLGVWPGDTSAGREVLLEIERGAPVTLSSLHATVHLGAHADAPSHYAAGAPAIEERRLEYYLGPCQVQHVPVARGQRIVPEMLMEPVRAERVLLATGTFPDPCHWNHDFAALDPELVDWLHAAGVITVGIDTPSVDLMNDPELRAHRRVLACDMAILEGLILTGVPAGLYELIALPLPLVGFDASPVRAILRTPPTP
jgi:arylformamidase